MQRIPRDQAPKYAFDWRDAPVLRVRCGESFEIETHDASRGYQPGALSYLGDVHASQGDTEFTGTAAETTARSASGSTSPTSASRRPTPTVS